MTNAVLSEQQKWHLQGIDLYKHAKEGSRMARMKVAESVASGEFPAQIAPLVRRQLKAKFETVPRISDAFTTETDVLSINVDEQYNIYTVGDQANIPGANMGDTFVPGGLPSLGPREAYPEIGLQASGKTVRAGKKGEAFGIDWEAIVRLNGSNVNIIDDAVKAFGRHAGQSVDIDVAKLFVTPTGFATSGLGLLNGAVQLTSGNGFVNAAGNTNPDLSNPITLQNAVQFALQQTLTLNASGTTQTVPVSYTKYALITTVSYAPYAKQALATKTVTVVPPRTGTGTPSSAVAGIQYDSGLDLGADITVYGWKWLKTIYPSIGNAWFLVPIPDDDDLPVISSTFLEGQHDPQFFVKSPNSLNYGSGSQVPYLDGDFDSDSVLSKVRFVHGAQALWNTGVVWSNGTGA